MLVTGRQWCDFVSFDPRIAETDERRLKIVRLERDEEMIDRLLKRIERAEEVLRELMG